jgi:hypothetical protein
LPGSTGPTTVPGGTVPDNGHGGGPGPSRGGDGHGGPGNGSTSTTVPPASEVYTYRSAGGTVTVRFSHGRLDLLSTSAAGGYHSSVRAQDPIDIDVRFDRSDGHGEWRIRVRVDDGGNLTHEVTQS